MAEHTKEPWIVDSNTGCGIFSNSTGNWVAHLDGHAGPANALRIVACVNSCAGVANDWLSRRTVDGLREECNMALGAIEELRRDVAELRRQRDKLRDACKLGLDVLQLTPSEYDWSESHDILTKALAETEEP